ncbi:MAG: DUF1847 domain-containing protein, partial [Proteobacteria bacterium]|nr:DUF1847 domain-containing protein [Pseudomonadota bacterium]
MDEKNQTDEKQIQCGYCPKKTCFKGDLTKIPKFCPTNIKPEILERSKEVLKDPENLKMAQDVARTWKDYGKLTRIEETVLYAQLRGYQKIGLAFCVGLSQEAELFANILFNEGFDVVSASCSCAALSSEDIELPEEDK